MSVEELRARVQAIEGDLRQLARLQKQDADVAEGLLRDMEYQVEQLEDAVEGLERRMQQQEADNAPGDTQSV